MSGPLDNEFGFDPSEQFPSNEREEMLSDEKKKAGRRENARNEVIRLVKNSRAFVVIAVMENGDMPAFIVSPGYSDSIALAQEGGSLMSKHLSKFKDVPTEEI